MISINTSPLLSLQRRLLMVLITILLSTTILLPGVARAKVYIDINSPSERLYPIAVQDFKRIGAAPFRVKGADAAIGLQLGEIIRSDLEMSGLFYVLDPLIYLEDVNDAGIKIGKFDFEDWKLIGSEALVKGGFTVSGDNLSIEARLFDVFLNRMVVGVQYRGKVSDVRRMGHKLVDTIIKKMTGQQGIFQSKIAFISPNKQQNDVYIMDIDGANLKKIVSNGALNMFPCWTRKMDGVLYTSYITGDPELFIRRLNKKEPVRMSWRQGLDYGPAWSPIKDLIAFSSSVRGNSELYLVKSNEPKKAMRLTKSWGIDIMPSWSPDGKKLAFVSDRAGSPQIYIMNRDGSKKRRLTYQGNYNTSPCWSPRGDRIAFVRKERNNILNIYSINVDGTNLRQLTDKTGNEERPCWSPDGRVLAFSSTREGVPGIYFLKPESETPPWRVSPPNLPATQPSWSPYPKNK